MVGYPRLMTAALHLASRGWYVFPLRRGSKLPLYNFTRWENRATTDPDQIFLWWREGAYNIGVATGKSRLIVVDCDTPKADASLPACSDTQSGVDVLEELAAQAGASTPDTFTVRTPSGGLHLYFKAPTGTSMRNTARKL